jgi:hypothetical protein
LIEEYAQENELEDFQKTWENYRIGTRNGITSVADVSLRNLFGQMSMLQSHAEMRVALLETHRDRAKLNLELERAKLLASDYRDGPMTKRNADVESSQSYQSLQQALQSFDDEVTIAKGIARATTIAANSLSRELSARLKD